MRICVFFLLLGVALGDVSLEFPPDFSWEELTPLDEYVHEDDGYWNYTELTSYYYPDRQVTVYVYNMTSQKWMDETFVDRPIWWHFISIAVPDAPTVRHSDLGFIYIDGGNNNLLSSPPDQNDTSCLAAARTAELCGCYAGYLTQVPNQPVHFENDPEYLRRTEDAIIAWSWHSFLDDPTYYKLPKVVLRMPMTKASKRGLDTIAAVAAEKQPLIADVTRFGATGMSKRGWTAWSLAAVDSRVMAVAPIVFSLLNLTTVLDNHNRAMGGGWSFALAPYFNEGLTRQFFDPNVILRGGIADYEDMFRFRSRLGMIPKLSIAATADEFFFPQDFLAWWDEMPGPASKHMTIEANTDHILFPYNGKIMQTILGWFYCIIEDIPLPEVSSYAMHTEEGVRVVMNAWPAPDNMTAYVGNSVKGKGRRDFRILGGSPTLPQVVIFRQNNVTELGPGEYTYYAQSPDLASPAPGRQADTTTQQWSGVFIAAYYDTVPNWPMKFTTPMAFTPNTYPANKCTSPDTCEGWLW